MARQAAASLQFGAQVASSFRPLTRIGTWVRGNESAQQQRQAHNGLNLSERGSRRRQRDCASRRRPQPFAGLRFPFPSPRTQTQRERKRGLTRKSDRRGRPAKGNSLILSSFLSHLPAAGYHCCNLLICSAASLDCGIAHLNVFQMPSILVQ